MSLQEINNRMIQIEERINLEEHKLNLDLGGRCHRTERLENSDEKIKERLERLENEWDRLAESIHN